VGIHLTQATAISGVVGGRTDPTCCAYLNELDSQYFRVAGDSPGTPESASKTHLLKMREG